MDESKVIKASNEKKRPLLGPKIDLTDDTIEPNLNDKHTESILVDNSHDFSDGEADEDKHEAPPATEKSQADNCVKACGNYLILQSQAI